MAPSIQPTLTSPNHEDVAASFAALFILGNNSARSMSSSLDPRRQLQSRVGGFVTGRSDTERGCRGIGRGKIHVRRDISVRRVSNDVQSVTCDVVQ